MRFAQIATFCVLVTLVFVGCSKTDESPPASVAYPHAIDDNGFPYPADNNSCVMPDPPYGRMCVAFANVNHIAWTKVIDMQWVTQPIALLDQDSEPIQWITESDCSSRGGSVEPSLLLTFETISASRSAVNGAFTFEMGLDLRAQFNPRPIPGKVPGTTEWVGATGGTRGTLSIGEEVGVFARIDPDTHKAELVHFYSYDEEGHLEWPLNACSVFDDGPPSALTRETLDTYVNDCDPFNETALDNWGEGYPMSLHHPTCRGASEG